MSFFGKFKPGLASSTSTTGSGSKKDIALPQSTALQKHIANINEPVRTDGSDKFFGFENYGSTCYCNSIIQCLYYSAPFRENVINFPTKDFLAAALADVSSRGIKDDQDHGSDGAALSPRTTATPSAPYPNPTSPARKPTATVGTFPNNPQKSDAENKDSPEYKKKMAIQQGPVLDMTRDLSRGYGMDESLFTSLKDIFEAIIAHKSRFGVVSPHKFLEVLRKENEMFRSAMHQDAHEFLNLLLNAVVENVEQFSKKHQSQQPVSNGGPRSNGSLIKSQQQATASGVPNLDARWVHDIFEGVLTSETRCLTCETVSQRDEAFLDLSVDIDSHTSVTSCLRKFSQEEMLCERNKFHCDNCAGLQEAEKRMKIKRLPKILALHLKRFKYTEDLQRLQKLFHRVVYPFHLRLFNTTDDAEDADRLYELYAVVVHIGGGPFHGHYVSIVKTQDRGWLLFDDELVEPVDKNYVLNFFGGEPVPGSQDARQLACAYVLFYQETTLEAVLKEQELEGQTAAAAAAAAAPPTSVVETGNGKSEFEQLLGITTPIEEEVDLPMESLAHTVTASSNAATSFADSPVALSRSKKELKQDEKERKAAQKAEEKAQMLKQREASDKRVEALRKHDQETRHAIEASKQSAANEAKLRADGSAEAPSPEKSSGFSRFTRPGSLSLRARSNLFGGNKNKDLPPPPVSPTFALHHESIDEDSVMTALPVVPILSPLVADELVKENKEKKPRFSIGRKRSTQVL